MYRSNGHITTYFKPSNHTPPCQNKCHSSEHTLEGPRAIRRLASGVAGQGQTERQKCLNNEQLAQGLDVHTMAAGSGNSSQQWPLHQHAKSDDNSPLSSQHDKSPQDKSSEMPFVPSLYEPRSRSFEISGSKRPILASSQRMVKNGEVIIKNSDEESHSDTSLEDLDNLLGSRKPSERESLTYPKPELSRLSSRSKKDGDYMNTRRRTRESAHTDEAFPLRPDLPVQRKKYRFSLESLAKERKQEEAFKENIAQANTMAKSLVQKRKRIDENGRLRTETVGLGADIIDTIMKDHGDDGDIGRLKTAIQRTEALHLSKSWSFFDSHSEVSLSEQEKFPSIGDGRIERLFGGTSSRQQAFLSGYIGEYALKETLPDDVLLWIMDAICVEPRDDLRYSYIATLTNAEKQFTSLLSPNLIDVLFRKLGAHAPALDHERPIVPYAVLSQGNVSFDRPGLLSLLGLIRGVARGMASESRIHMIRVLCRLAIDQSIVNSWHAMNAIENLFASLSEAVPNEDSELELQTALTTVFHSLTDATLRLLLLQMIPATSHFLILFRRRLALAFFYEDLQYLTKQQNALVDFKAVARRLKKPPFIVNNTTDYAVFAASIEILSIGLDCADPPPSPFNKETQRVFDQEIDTLSSKIYEVFTQVIDIGASHMGRTEAKEVLEGFQYRLSYAVRTKPPPKKPLFGDATVGGAAERMLMKAYLDRSKQEELVAI